MWASRCNKSSRRGIAVGMSRRQPEGQNRYINYAGGFPKWGVAVCRAEMTQKNAAGSSDATSEELGAGAFPPFQGGSSA